MNKKVLKIVFFILLTQLLNADYINLLKDNFGNYELITFNEDIDLGINNLPTYIEKEINDNRIIVSIDPNGIIYCVDEVFNNKVIQSSYYDFTGNAVLIIIYEYDLQMNLIERIVENFDMAFEENYNGVDRLDYSIEFKSNFTYPEFENDRIGLILRGTIKEGHLKELSGIFNQINYNKQYSITYKEEIIQLDNNISGQKSTTEWIVGNDTDDRITTFFEYEDPILNLNCMQFKQGKINYIKKENDNIYIYEFYKENDDIPTVNEFQQKNILSVKKRLLKDKIVYYYGNLITVVNNTDEIENTSFIIDCIGFEIDLAFFNKFKEFRHIVSPGIIPEKYRLSTPRFDTGNLMFLKPNQVKELKYYNLD